MAELEYTIVTGVNSDGKNNSTIEIFEKYLKYLEGEINILYFYFRCESKRNW